MSITAAQLLEAAKQKTSIVEVDGFGKVTLRTCPAIQLSRRWIGYTDQQTNQVIPEEHAKSGLHKIIDQVCGADGAPLFTDDDLDKLAALDARTIGELYNAIDTFNGDEVKNE
jgi:hypothetical protein